MQSCRRAPCSPTANTTAAQETNRCLLRDSESSMMLLKRTRRDQVRAARSSKAPAPKPVHDPHEHGSTSAAGRVSVPASMGTRHVGPGHQAQAVQQGSKAPVGRYKCILIGKSVRSQRRALRKPEDVTRVAHCSRKEEDLPELERRELARRQHPRRGTPASMAAHVHGKHWATAERALVPQVPKNHPGALAKLDSWEDISTKELSQEEDIKIHSIWVNPLFPELLEGSCRPSSSGTHAAGVTAGHQQDASADPAHSTNTEPAAAALAAAAEEEEQRSPLAPTEQEAAKAPASLFSKQGTAAQTGSQAPAPHSPTAHTVALQDAAQWDVSEVRHKRPAEKQDSKSSMMLLKRARRDEVQAARSSKAPAPKPVHDPHEHGSTSAAGRVSVPASMGTRHVGPGHQARAVQQGSKAPVGRYKCILIGKPVRSQRRARRKPEVISHVADCSRKEEDLQKLKSRFLAHSQHRRRGSPAGSPASMAAHVRGKHWAKAERALVPQVPKNHPGALAKLDSWEDISTKELSQEEDIKIHSIWVNPLFPELLEGSCRPSSSGTHAAGVTAGHLQDASADPAHSTNTEPAAAALAAAAEEEEQRSPLAPTEQEAAKAPASLFSKQGTAAQTGSQAPAPHSPTAHTVALQDAAWWDMSDVLHELEAVIQERSQQPVEQRHSAQSMDAAMAVKPRAATEDSESTLAAEPRGEPSTASPVPDERQDGEHMASPMSGDPPGEASAAIVSPAAHDHEGAFLLPENAVDNTATPHLAPAAENGDNETACPLPWEPWHQEAPGVLAKEDDKWEDSLELFQDPHADPPEGQAASEQSGNTSPCSGSRDEPEDEPGIAALPHTPARRRRPSLFRRVLRALRRAFSCTCITAQREQQRPAASGAHEGAGCP
ncbi:nucleolar protein dao-5-like isoform X2 [Falco rusticolus]|uniref:nucleolar protein dao-5-like isoform X2 n=1 Tax=Falco rusticolus TaxID=120794 RepID=UPI0018865D25|nr:nucleolar protein dao-5-like isoform X2 [Falco rusticolus]